jgi:hypothetical protein
VPKNLRVKDYWTDFITIMWDAPQTDGGSPITGYVVEKRDMSRPTWVKAGSVDADNTQFKASNLFEGIDYIFRVYAVNKVGPSKEAALLERPCKAKMPFGIICFIVLFLLSRNIINHCLHIHPGRFSICESLVGTGIRRGLVWRTFAR